MDDKKIGDFVEENGGDWMVWKEIHHMHVI